MGPPTGLLGDPGPKFSLLSGMLNLPMSTRTSNESSARCGAPVPIGPDAGLDPLATCRSRCRPITSTYQAALATGWTQNGVYDLQVGGRVRIVGWVGLLGRGRHGCGRRVDSAIESGGRRPSANPPKLADLPATGETRPTVSQQAAETGLRQGSRMALTVLGLHQSPAASHLQPSPPWLIYTRFVSKSDHLWGEVTAGARPPVAVAPLATSDPAAQLYLHQRRRCHPAPGAPPAAPRQRCKHQNPLLPLSERTAI